MIFSSVSNESKSESRSGKKWPEGKRFDKKKNFWLSKVKKTKCKKFF